MARIILVHMSAIVSTRQKLDFFFGLQVRLLVLGRFFIHFFICLTLFVYKISSAKPNSLRYDYVTLLAQYQVVGQFWPGTCPDQLSLVFWKDTSSQIWSHLDTHCLSTLHIRQTVNDKHLANLSAKKCSQRTFQSKTLMYTRTVYIINYSAHAMPYVILII